MAPSYTEILVGDEIFHIVTLPDRRPTAGASQPVKWLYQMIIESYLYHNGDAEARGPGAFYRLLQRTPGAAGRALCLRKASAGQGLITDAEWDLLREPLESSVRVLTLVPVDVAVKAITVFGETNRSAKLIEALGYDRPSEWDEAGEEEGEGLGEEGEGQGEGQGEDDDDDEGESDSGEHSGDRSDSETGIAATEQFECDEDGDDEAADERGGGGSEGRQQGGRAKKKTRVAPYTLMDIPPALQRELDSFAEWRLKPINRERDGVSVEPATAAGNRADALRLLGWLKSEKNIAPSLGGVFGSERLDQAVQAFMDHLRACGRLYSTCAGYIKSFVAVARFVYAARAARAPPGTAVSAAPVDAMCRAHRQIMQQARLEQKFSPKPKAWLDWAAVLTARARAVRAYELRKEEEGGPGARTRLFDAALLTWLTVVPPDRVGVARKLQLGVTLKPTSSAAGGGGGFELDLRTPDAHKTAAIFGPSTTAVPAAACALLTAWLAEAGLTASTAAATKPYVFVLGSHARGTVDHSKPLGAPRWTEVVKAVLKRQAGVAFAPKDLRSSFITFLLSDANSDEALKKAVATAMRHSTAMQTSGAYDKDRAERTWASAVQVAGAYAARFE
jgi:hypothetical protein